MQLEPCPACHRHVRIEERSCPFCSAEIASAMARAPKRILPSQRLGRAALMSFSLTVGASALVGCDDDGSNDDPSTQHGDADAGKGTAASDAGPSDAGSSDAGRKDAGAAVDAGAVDAGYDGGEPQVVPIYGALAQTY